VATTVATTPIHASPVMVCMVAPVVAGIRRPESPQNHRTGPTGVEPAMIGS
jgi:hypothetical protein